MIEGRPKKTRRVELSYKISDVNASLSELVESARGSAKRTPQQIDAEKAARFLSKIEMVESGCWEWTGCRDLPPLQPYGNFCVGGPERVIKAHRFSYALFIGPVPEEVLVLHECDNPPCCNPDHLFLGSHRDNTQDMFAKGREHPRAGIRRPDMEGENSCNAKLTAEKVIQIRSMYVPGIVGAQRIANLFGVSKCAIQCIVTRKTWRHV